MKRLSRMLENTMAAVAFAEAGEDETARRILREDIDVDSAIAELREKVHLTVDDLISMAITFAEAGEHEQATEILEEAEEKLRTIKGAHQRAHRKTVNV